MVEKFVSKQQVAETLGISTQTVDRLIAAGSLRSYKVGKRRVGISDSSLREYVAGITDNVSLNQEDKR